jgi:hypothetical protein
LCRCIRTGLDRCGRCGTLRQWLRASGPCRLRRRIYSGSRIPSHLAGRDCRRRDRWGDAGTNRGIGCGTNRSIQSVNGWTSRPKIIRRSGSQLDIASPIARDIARRRTDRREMFARRIEPWQERAIGSRTNWPRRRDRHARNLRWRIGLPGALRHEGCGTSRCVACMGPVAYSIPLDVGVRVSIVNNRRIIAQRRGRNVNAGMNSR